MAKGAATSGLMQGGMTALQGGNIGDIAEATAKGAAEGAATGAVTGAAGQMVGAAKAGSTTAGKAAMANAGNASAPVPKGMKQVGYSGQVPSVGGLTPKPQYVPLSTGEKITGALKTGLVNTGSAIKNNAREILTQGILQGGLSLITAGMGAKTAKEANEVSRQSLLFQQQTYREQKAEQDKKEAQLKEDAWSAYSSANSFGESLYGNGTNSLLFTKDYKTNPTGNFSILSGNTAKLTDYT